MLACFGEKRKKPLPKDYRDCSISCVNNNRQAGNNRTKARNSQILHKRKVTTIKQQIKDGTYNFDEKLDLAMDKLIENILSPKN